MFKEAVISLVDGGFFHVYLKSITFQFTCEWATIDQCKICMKPKIGGYFLNESVT